MKQKQTKSKRQQISNLIKANLENYYGKGPIPPDAYFLKQDSPAKSILNLLLIESKHSVSQFASKAADSILSYNKSDITFTSQYLKHEQELKETTSYLNSISLNLGKSSKITFNLIKTRSALGPIYLDIKLSASETRLNPNESISINFNIEDSVEIKISVNEGVKFRTLETFSMFFRELSKEDLSGLKNDEIEKIVEKRTEEFEVKLLVGIELVNKDRVVVLEKKVEEIKKGLNEQNEAGIIYNELIHCLEIFHDVDTGGFKSLIKNLKMNRENCCGPCLVM